MAVRADSTIPIKLQVLDASGLNISSATLRVTATAITLTSTAVSSAPADSGNANPDANFRYDTTLAGYVFAILDSVGRGIDRVAL